MLIEYCEGGDLKEYLAHLKETDQYNSSTIFRNFYEILEAFEFLHSSHIIHREYIN